MATEFSLRKVTRRSIGLTLALPLLGKSQDVEVLLFLATECPISNRYVPELNRIAAQYLPRGMSFRVLLPEPGLTAAKAHAWAKDFSLTLPYALDTRQLHVRRAGATMTPEVAVFATRFTTIEPGKAHLVYRGRIDDRYVSWGKARAAPSRRDLCEVLDECLAGKTPALRTTRSWGCFIESRKQQ